MKHHNIKECLVLVMFIELVSFNGSSIFDFIKSSNI